MHVKKVIIFFFFFFFFLWERRGNASCTVAPKRRVWDSIGACRWACLPVGQYAPLSYPLKPLLRRCPGHIPLSEIDYGARSWSEVGQAAFRPQFAQVALSIGFHFFCQQGYYCQK